MANITEILGTDSVSSSRPVINTNFELLNDELASVISLLNPTTQVLSGVSNITTAAITVSQNNLSLLQVNGNGGVINTDFTFNNAITMGGKIIKSGVIGEPAGTGNLSPTSIEYSTYFIAGDFTLPSASDGQEVTIIAAASAAILTGAGVTLGATSIVLDGANSTVTLRCFSDKWYVVSSYATTIQ